MPLVAPRGKLQIAVTVPANERRDPTKSITLRVEFSSDGKSPDLEAHEITWVGNEKPVKPGWPTDGPVLRIESRKPVDYSDEGLPIYGQWMDGIFVRVRLDGDVNFVVDLTEIPVQRSDTAPDTRGR